MSNDKTLQVEIKHVYGKETVYPVNETAKLVAELVGQRTLTRKDIGVCKKLGYTIEIVQLSMTLL